MEAAGENHPAFDRILLAILAAGLALRLLVAWAPFSWQADRGPLIDDSFYGFSIARSLAAGSGPSADGIHPTSGFQPLYTLALVPLFKLAPGSQILPLHLALTLLALCGAASGWFLFRITRRFASRPAALFAAFLGSFSPYFLSQGLNGLETGLFGLAVLAALDYYLGVARSGADFRSAALLGALLGLTILARVDGAILAAAVGLGLLRTGGPGGRRLPRAAVTAVVALLVVTPYLLFLQIRFGALLPESGAATRFLSLAYGTRFVLGPRGSWFFPPETAPPVFLMGSFRKAVQVLSSEPLLFPGSLLTSLAARFGLFGPRAWLLVLAAGALLLVNLLALRRSPAAGNEAWRGFTRVAGLAGLLWVPAYAFFAFGQWWFARYFFPLFLFLAVASGVALDTLGNSTAVLRRLGTVRLTLLAAVLHLAWFAGQAPELFFRHKPNLNVGAYLEAARHLDAALPSGAVAGAFQSGTLSYFARTRVANLDGVVNAGAARALREGRMAAYLREEGIEAVIDWPWILEALLVRRSAPGEARALGPASPAGPFLLIRLEPQGGNRVARAAEPQEPISGPKK